ncbi:triose-phosphate isomerase [Patescibacteria group bacterium]|nr:triose-phosphate isomerase [Patescibacteria group bacterium]
MIFVNFKTYEQGTGANALEMVAVLEQVAGESGVKIIPVVQTSDIKELVVSSKLEIWAQKIDSVEYGAHTGAVLPEAVFEDGAVGTFLNHSENKFENFSDLIKANQRAMEVGLKTLIFAGDVSELEKVAKLKPTFISYEPAELVGSETTSVAEAKPEIIAKAVEVARKNNLPLIVGAGIKSEKDVRKSLELGAVGVAVASDIVKAEDPRREIKDLVEGFK